ncbi:MAG: type II secretion system minor pseudopilin GspI [Brevundimonas sp.]
MSDRGIVGASARHAAARCLNAQPARSAWPGRAGRFRRVDDRGPDKEGFTLIELLVALAVFSLAAMALLNLSGENTRSASRVETRTLGGVVAENLAVEAMIQPAIGEGTVSGETPLAGRPWRWIRTVTATDDPDILRVDIRVRDAGGQAAERTVFRARRAS